MARWWPRLLFVPTVSIAGALALLAAPSGQPETPRTPPIRAWHVTTGAASGDGSADRPFSTLAAALAVAAAGDEIAVGPGVYDETLVTQRGGTETSPLVVRAAVSADRPIIGRRGRAATLAHPYLIVDGLVFDGRFGADDAVRVTSASTRLVLRNVEVRNAGRDCIDMAAPTQVLIEGASIHHCLNATNGRTDAHGIVAGAARGLTIRDSDIHSFSGDAIQLDPGRAEPGWTNLRVERARLWLAPLPEPANGFPAGAITGENGIDTKTPATGGRATLTVIDTEAWGFRDGLIANMAAFNIKERVDATFDGVTVHASQLAFRLRGPAEAGAGVTIRNAVVHHVSTAIRYEDDLSTLNVHHLTAGRGVVRLFQRASSGATRPDVRNLLLLGMALPAEAAGRGLLVNEDAFVDAKRDDYRLRADSPARDTGRPVAGTSTDRVGVPRPQGSAPDVGAHEYCAPCPPRP